MQEDDPVILVNTSDQAIGVAPKLDAHRNAQLHRAFSVFIRDPQGRLLLQRRADGKYHSGGLWTNACCGHPRPGEQTRDAAQRRLREEMGIECELVNTGAFTYRAEVGDELIEYEYDHVFVGAFSGAPSPNPLEIQDWRWISLDDVAAWLARDRAAFTAWFAEALTTSGLGKSRSSTFADERTPGTPPPGLVPAPTK